MLLNNHGDGYSNAAINLMEVIMQINNKRNLNKDS